MSNKDLLRQIQNEAVDGNSDLSTVLRKCLVLASRLGNQLLKNWAQWELDGYPESRQVPAYRVLDGVESFGHFFGAMHYQLQNEQLEISRLPEQVQEDYRSPQLRQGVRAIAEMIRGAEGVTVRWAWPAEARGVFDHNGYRDDLRLMQAWISLPVSRLVGVLDTIRNRVLSFALEIGALNLELEEETPSEELKKETAAQINQTFNQTIFGSVSNVGTAGSISQTTIVAAGDLEALKDRLRETGLSETDLNDLENAIKADETESKPSGNKVGEKVSKWLGDTFKKAMNGLIKASPELIIKAVEHYYGI